MKKLINYLAGLTVLSLTAPVMAGSYQLNDYSVTGLGRAYAGQGIMGDDYSAIAFNPAGMTLMKQSGVQTGMTFVNLKSDVKGLGRYAGQSDKMDFWAPIPQFFGQYNVNDKLSVGLGVYAPYGLKTEYGKHWFGSDTAILSKLDIVDINTAAAYKLTDHWSIGAGVIARYIYGHMTNTLTLENGDRGKSDFQLDDWTATGLFGVMYEPTDATRFGLSYRMGSRQKVTGDHTISKFSTTMGKYFNQIADGWASPDLPETFTLSGYQRYKDVGFSGTARWTHWSKSFPKFAMGSNSRLFDYLSANPEKGAMVGVENNEKVSYYRYRNSWTLTAGLDWYYNDNWTFRCGTGWDQSPAGTEDNRTIRIPDNDRIWASVGASFMYQNWQFDAAYAHMFGKEGKALEVSDPSSAKVKYENLRSNILGVQVQYKF